MDRFNNLCNRIRTPWACHQRFLKFIGVLIASLIIFIYGYMIITENEVYQECLRQGQEGNVSILLQTGDEIIQQIPVYDRSISGLKVLFSTYGNEITAGEIYIEIIDEKNQLYYETTVDATKITDNQYLEFEFSPITSSSEMVIYTLCMTFNDIEKQTICVQMTDKNVYDELTFSINGDNDAADIVVWEKLDSRNNRFLQAFTIVMALAFGVVSCAYFMIYKFNMRVHHIYLFVTISLGLIYMMIIPVNTAPDEEFHVYSAYSVSNSMLGIDNSSNGTIMMRADDADYIYYGKIENRTFFERYYALLKEVFAENTAIVETMHIPVYDYFHVYFFSGLGITVGRLLNLSTLWVLLLGRLFNLAVFVWGTYYAIQKIPFGKMIVFIWALLPITMQQAVSYSYDSLVLTLCAIVISLSLKLAYGDTSNITKVEKSLLFICILLLAPTKSLAITPLCTLPLLAAFRKEKEQKNIIFYTVSMIVISLVVIWLIRIEPVNNALTVGNKGITHMASTVFDGRGYELEYLLKDPKNLFLIICNTVYKQWDFYLETFLGRRLGYFEIILPLHVVLPYFIMLIIAGVRKNNEPQYLSRKAKAFLILVVLLGYGFASGGMLLGWTHTNMQYVEGVQGRYLLPFAIPAFLIIRSGKLLVDEEVDRKLMFSSIWLEMLVVFCIYRHFV